MSFVTAELRIVMIEDQESEAELALNHLRQAGRHCVRCSAHRKKQKYGASTDARRRRSRA